MSKLSGGSINYTCDIMLAHRLIYTGSCFGLLFGTETMILVETSRVFGWI